MRECVTCLLSFVLRTSRSNLLQDWPWIEFLLVFTRNCRQNENRPLKWRVLFRLQAFLTDFLRICFCFVSLKLLLFSVKGNFNQVLSLYIFSPLLTGCVHSSGTGTVFAARKLKFYISAAPIYKAIFVVCKMIAQFWSTLRKMNDTGS